MVLQRIDVHKHYTVLYISLHKLYAALVLEVGAHKHYATLSVSESERCVVLYVCIHVRHADILEVLLYTF